MIAIVALHIFTLVLAAPPPKPGETWDPTDRYVVRQLEGWKVRVHPDLLKNEKLAADTLRLLEVQLYQITRIVPADAVTRLRKVTIWVELAHPRHPCMCYHVCPDWLKSHAMNPEKARGVEIANARNFLSWCKEQPWMVLHELAHAYHHQVFGYDHAGIQAGHERAVRAKNYERVRHINGREVRHYALTNPMEYFAELTESYFGTNDFYPFVRAELKEHDPAGYALIEELWGVVPKKK